MSAIAYFYKKPEWNSSFNTATLPNVWLILLYRTFGTMSTQEFFKYQKLCQGELINCPGTGNSNYLSTKRLEVLRVGGSGLAETPQCF